jgi:uncharacterized protein (TIGR00369 family)
MARDDSPTPPSLEVPQGTLEKVINAFEDKIPFNRFLGLRFDAIDSEGARLSFDMRDELVGNFLRGSLHGGVISSALDTVGGLVAFLAVLKRLDGPTLEAGLAKLTNIGTIDLRIDYLRSGVGRRFTASGTVLRSGNKVAVTRMELVNDEGTLIAVGTGTYLVG